MGSLHFRVAHAQKVNHLPPYFWEITPARLYDSKQLER